LFQQGSSFTFGTDPTEAVTRLEVAYEHAKLRNGDVVDAATTRLDVALFERIVLRADVPFAYVDPAGPAEKGFGDVRAQIGWRAFSDPTFSIFFGGGVVLDSAEEDVLGSGQKQVVAMVAASGALPESRSRLYQTIEHFVSFDTDNDREGVALTKLDIHLMTEWSPTVWTQAGGEFFVDWKGGEDVGLNLDVEIGTYAGAGFSFWVRPGVGLFGEDVPGVVDWNVVAGVRWVF
jgi:hypothetical protein